MILPSATATFLRSSRRVFLPPSDAKTRTFLLEESRMRRSLAVAETAPFVNVMPPLWLM